MEFFAATPVIVLMGLASHKCRWAPQRTGGEGLFPMPSIPLGCLGRLVSDGSHGAGARRAEAE
jgi:hypothetical protein